MKNDKNGQEIRVDDYVFISNEDGTDMGKVIIGMGNKVCCVELEEGGKGIYSTGCEIDLNKYSSEDLEIIDYEEVEKYFGVD